ncbi:MAG: ATP-binding cassette domain-containing protein [Pseudomonadota bacterium]|nr:ATP-binding cassette domain-containing protein [Pseudomonadota bacterium]
MTVSSDAGEPKFKINALYKIFGEEPEIALKALRDRNLTKSELLEEYNHVLALEDINFNAKAGEISVIMGLSGSGKSTLIRHINRLIEPTSGEIIYGGRDILHCSANEIRQIRREKMSMVFQNFGLLPHRTVIQNVGLSLEARGFSRKRIFSEAEKWLDEVGLQGYEGKYPDQLSGGMQQRVGIARALASNAEVMLMDEAFSALDPLIRSDMQDLLLKLQKGLRKTIVFITHDLDEALKLADHLVILKDGKIVQQGDPQRVLIEPEDHYVFDFVSDTNRARVLRVRTIMEPISSTSHMFIEGEIDQEETLETMIKLSGGDISKNYLVKNGVDSVGIAKMERLLEALVPVKKNEIRSKEI